MTAKRRSGSATDRTIYFLETSTNLTQDSEITLEDADRVIAREYCLSSHLEGIACLPESLWWEHAMRIPMLFPVHGFSTDEIQSGLETYWGFMHAHRYRYGRAVQPTKQLDDLAPVVGAIIIDFRTRAYPKELSEKLIFKNARGYLNNLVLASIAAGDIIAFKKIEEYVSARTADHVHFFVWEAFWGCLTERTETISTLKSGLRLQLRTIPKTKDIKDFVSANRENSMFSNLSNLDDPGWAKVFNASGVGRVIRRSTRRKNTQR